MDNDINYMLTIEDFDKSRYVEYKKNVWIRKDLDIKTPIYHYIKVEYLYKMINESQLFFRNRPKFSDLKEQGKKDSLKYMFSCFTDATLGKEVAKIRVEEFEKRKKCAETRTAISCWTKDNHSDRNDESYILWKWFGEDCYRIQTTIKDLLDNLDVESYCLIVSQVEYKKETYDTSLNALVFRKDIRYADEQEVRFCVLNSSDDIHLKLKSRRKFIHKIRSTPFMDGITKEAIKNLLTGGIEWLNDKYENTTILEK